MPPVFYVEIKNKVQDFTNSTPTGLSRILVSRYYTEFNPSDPENIIDRLNNQNWAGVELTKVRNNGVKPKSIQIEQGDWDRRVDWVEEWEEIENDEIPYEEILGLKLYNIKRSVDLGADRVNEILLSSQVWQYDEKYAAHYQKLARKHKVTTITGKAIGNVSYLDLYEQIKLNKNVTELSLSYSKDTDTTAVTLRLEDSSDA